MSTAAQTTDAGDRLLAVMRGHVVTEEQASGIGWDANREHVVARAKFTRADEDDFAIFACKRLVRTFFGRMLEEYADDESARAVALKAFSGNAWVDGDWMHGDTAQEFAAMMLDPERVPNFGAWTHVRVVGSYSQDMTYTWLAAEVLPTPMTLVAFPRFFGFLTSEHCCGDTCSGIIRGVFVASSLQELACADAPSKRHNAAFLAWARSLDVSWDDVCEPSDRTDGGSSGCSGD